MFLFDSLEQIRGSLSNEQEVTHSVEVLFSTHLRHLEIPFVHLVYTVPPWLKFVLPGVDILVLPCIRLWENYPHRPECDHGPRALRSLVTKRFGKLGLERFFGPNPLDRSARLIDLCGGHFRDLLRLLRETLIRANDLPVADEAIERAIVRVRSQFLPISLADAEWLFEIERERATLLKTSELAEVNPSNALSRHTHGLIPQERLRVV